MKIVSDSFWALTMKVAGSVGAIAINIVLARMIEIDELGEYFLAVSFSMFLSTVGMLGLRKIVVKYAAVSIAHNQKDHLSKYISSVLVLGLFGCSIVTIFFLIIGPKLLNEIFGVDGNNLYFMFIAGWILFLGLGSLAAESFRGMSDIKYASIFNGSFASILSAVIFSVIYYFFSQEITLNIAILISFISAAVSAITAIILLYLRIPGNICVEKKIYANLLSDSYPLFITSILLFITTQADLWIVGAFTDSKETALYGAATKLLIIVWFPLFVINAVVQPIISRYITLGKNNELEQVLRSLATISVIVSLPVVFGLFFISDGVMAFIYGEQFRSGNKILFILAVGQLFNLYAGSCGLMLMLTGYQSLHMKITIISSMISIATAYLLVGNYGAEGVAYAFAASLAVYNTVMLFTVKYKQKIWTHAGRLNIKYLLKVA